MWVNILLQCYSPSHQQVDLFRFSSHNATTLFSFPLFHAQRALFLFNQYLIHETLSVVYGNNAGLDICLINKAETKSKTLVDADVHVKAYNIKLMLLRTLRWYIRKARRKGWLRMCKQFTKSEKLSLRVWIFKNRWKTIIF